VILCVVVTNFFWSLRSRRKHEGHKVDLQVFIFFASDGKIFIHNLAIINLSEFFEPQQSHNFAASLQEKPT